MLDDFMSNVSNLAEEIEELKNRFCRLHFGHLPTEDARPLLSSIHLLRSEINKLEQIIREKIQ